jgi:hypothetical protein
MPAVTDQNGTKRPKYADADGITGFSGNTTTPDVVSDHYPALTQIHPDVDDWYIICCYGDGNVGYQALNEIAIKQDTRTLADHENDVAPVLNSHFPNLERSGQEWAESFKVGDT